MYLTPSRLGVLIPTEKLRHFHGFRHTNLKGRLASVPYDKVLIDISDTVCLRAVQQFTPNPHSGARNFRCEFNLSTGILS